MRLKRALSVFLFVLAMLSSGLSYAASVYYVDGDRSDDTGDGTSWATAKKNVQTAIDQANAEGSPVEVWVKAGVYAPATQADSFTLKPYVKIYGGFAGGESALGDRDPASNHTILTGDINGDDRWIDNWGIAADGGTQKGLIVTGGTFVSPEVGWVLDAATATDNCGVVVTIPADSNLGSDTVIDGFIVTGGYQDSTGSEMHGGGIRNEDDNSVVTVAGCVISGNTLSYNGAGSASLYGAAISSPHAGNTINISSSTIGANAIVNISSGDNPKVSGVGIYNNESVLALTNCKLTGNSAVSISTVNTSDGYIDIYGVAVYNSGAASSVKGCTITDNRAVGESYDDASVLGCGIYNDGTGINLVVADTIISRNTSVLKAEADWGDLYGGGMYNLAAGVSVSNCTVNENTSTATSANQYINGEGGGIYCRADGFTLAGSVVQGNTLKVTAGRMAYVEGVGVCIHGENLTVVNTSISNNKGTAESTGHRAEGEGGGCHLSSHSGVVSGCSISDNTLDVTSRSTDSSQHARIQGGGVLFWNGPFEVINCTITGNRTTASSENTPGVIRGGGIFSEGRLYLLNTTLVDNQALVSSGPDATGLGGGLYQVSGLGKASVVMNSILWHNDLTVTADVGNVTLNGRQANNAVIRYSVVQYDYPTGTDIIDSDPFLGGLSDNGGPTKTMALSVDSPAVNAGAKVYKDSDKTYFYAVPSTSTYKKLSDDTDYTPASTDTCLSTNDQRGVARPQDAFIDMGAYELGDTYTVTFQADGSGGGTIEGEASQDVSYLNNATPVTAVPNDGYEFTGWTGDHTGAENPLTVEHVAEDMTVQANFAPAADSGSGGGGGCFIRSIF